jgi:hypothetical protein
MKSRNKQKVNIKFYVEFVEFLKIFDLALNFFLYFANLKKFLILKICFIGIKNFR